MRAIDIYNFRRNIEAANLHNGDTPINTIGELIALNDSINFIVNSWTRINLDKIKNYEKDKTLQP